MKFATTLKKVMEEKHLTGVKLSKMLGVSNKTISDWLGGRSPRNLDDVKKCADTLGVSLNYLLFAEEEQKGTLADLLEKTEIHTGMYEISIKKINKKE
jgi:transcriptional regulator with XRE-family HTH domain